MFKVFAIRIILVVFFSLFFFVLSPQKIYAGSTCSGNWTCTKGSNNYTYNCASFNGMTEPSCTGGGGGQGNYCNSNYERTGGCSWSSGVAPTSPPAATSAPAPTNPLAATQAPAPTTATSGSLSCPPNNNYSYACFSPTECYSLKSVICTDNKGGKYCCNGKVDRSYCDGQLCGTTGGGASPTPASGVGAGDGDGGGANPPPTPFPTPTNTAADPNWCSTYGTTWSCACNYGYGVGGHGPQTCTKFGCNNIVTNQANCAASPGVGTGDESGGGPTLAPSCHGADEINQGGTANLNITCTCDHGGESGNFGPAHCYNATSECSYGLSGLMRDCAATASEGTGGDEDAPDSDVPALGGAGGGPVEAPTSAPASCRNTCNLHAAHCQADANNGLLNGKMCLCVTTACGNVFTCGTRKEVIDRTGSEKYTIECSGQEGSNPPPDSIPTLFPAESANYGADGIIPSLTAYPTLAQTCTTKPLLSVGNADNDCYVNWTDSALWMLEFAGVNSTRLADFNVDGKVNLADFEVWRRNASTFGN